MTDPSAETAKSTVVVVDDTQDLRRLVVSALHRAGDFRVVAEAGDGREAIDIVAMHQPDVVLLDISMPIMDGLTALPHIRERCPSTVVVMLSGVTGRGVVEQATAAGAAGFVHKGRPLSELVHLVRDLLAE